MLRFFLSRVATAIPALFIIIALAFFLMRLAPGGPFDTERALDPEIAKNLRRIYRLDLPLVQQFWIYLQNLAYADLGPSLHWRDFTVNELFAKALPISASLGAKAMLLAILAGTALGLAGAMSKNAKLARASSMARRYLESFCRSLSSRLCSSSRSACRFMPCRSVAGTMARGKTKSCR